MRADSFMTSPSCPVSTSPPLPGIDAASTNSTSPPTPVTARPVATPGTAVRTAASWKNFGRPSASRTAARSMVTGAARRARRDPGRRLPKQRAQLPLQLPDARFARVVGDDEAQHRVVHRHFVGPQAIPLDLPRPQMPAGNGHLLVSRVAVEPDHLHAVEQRRRNRIGDVRGRDEQHLREIELDVEIVIAERVVLRRVEHLEQRRRRIAAPVGADLVDLVEHDHRVHRAGVAQRAHQPSRQRADVGAAMAADFRFVAHAAERHADELPPGGSRNRLANRGLARSRRADQREDDAGPAVCRSCPRSVRSLRTARYSVMRRFTSSRPS